MTTDWSLPKSYRPYHKIIICGNMLVGVMIPFEINGNVPILIGTNRKPKVWLYAPAGEPDSLWQPVVKANRSLHTAILVKGVGTKTLSIVVGDVKVLKLIDQADGTPEVTQLDLRPFGLSIHGDHKGFMVGSSHLSGNTFQNVRVMVGIGEGRPEKDS